MITKKEFYKEVYFFEQPEKLTDNQWDSLVMMGRKNYEPYFSPFKTKRPHEVLRDVELVEFEKESDMFDYINEISPTLLINFSLEHDKPYVLQFSS